MLCCIGIIVGSILVSVTGQFYLLPASIAVGAAGDAMIFRNFVGFKKLMPKRDKEEASAENTACCGFDFLQKKKVIKKV